MEHPVRASHSRKFSRLAGRDSMTPFSRCAAVYLFAHFLQPAGATRKVCASDVSCGGASRKTHAEIAAKSRKIACFRPVCAVSVGLLSSGTTVASCGRGTTRLRAVSLTHTREGE